MSDSIGNAFWDSKRYSISDTKYIGYTLWNPVSDSQRYTIGYPKWNSVSYTK